MSGLPPSRGDIWFVNFDPILGREQAGPRPALVVSVDKFNHGPAELVVVLPLTSKNERQPLHVEITPPEGGLTIPSFVKTDDMRSVSKGRCKQFMGEVPARTLAVIQGITSSSN